MKLVFMGSGAFGCPTLRWLCQSEHEVCLVVTQPARPSGRGRQIAKTPVHEMADDLGVKILEAEDINAPVLVDELRTHNADLGLAIAFGQKLRPAVLDLFPAGCINLHASLLPKYRGAAPINWAIVNLEERTGCTVFRIVDRMDAGPVLASRWTLIKPEETAGELHDRLSGIGVDAVEAALITLVGNATEPGIPQDDSLASKAPKLKKSDGYILFDLPAKRVASHICGMTPWPGAKAEFQSQDGRIEHISITRARVAESATSTVELPGTVDSRCYVATGEGYLEILEIRPASGKLMTWPDFVNGRHVSAGDQFKPLSS